MASWSNLKKEMMGFQAITTTKKKKKKPNRKAEPEYPAERNYQDGK